MGSDKDDLTDEILEVSKQLRELFREKLCPSYLPHKDNIALTVPDSDEDYRLGIFLYDIQDHSAITPSYSISSRVNAMPGNSSYKGFPGKAVELSYMIFCNESRRFGGINRERVQVVLNQTIRVLHDNPVIPREEAPALQLSFARLELDMKIRLWESFHKPLQPAVYIKAVPVLIASERREAFTSVRERDYQLQKI